MNPLLAFQQPIKRWPLLAHVAVAACVLLALALASWGFLQQEARSLRTHQSELAAAQKQLLALQHKSPPRDFTQTLPTSARADDVVADLNTQAQKLGLQLSSLSITYQPASANELGKVQFTLALSGSYVAGKALLAALLDRYASLGVQMLSVRDMPNGTSGQAMQWVLVLFVKD